MNFSLNSGHRQLCMNVRRRRHRHHVASALVHRRVTKHRQHVLERRLIELNSSYDGFVDRRTGSALRLEQRPLHALGPAFLPTSTWSRTTPTVRHL
jgi:hypothetical protein